MSPFIRVAGACLQIVVDMLQGSQPIVVGAIPGLVDLVYIRKKVENASK